jgi:hypothetical protein
VGRPRLPKNLPRVSCSACAGSDVHCCTYYSSLFCDESNCNVSGANYACANHFNHCDSGGICWNQSGYQCCDCLCSWCSPCNSAKCICHGAVSK